MRNPIDAFFPLTGPSELDGDHDLDADDLPEYGLDTTLPRTLCSIRYSARLPGIRASSPRTHTL